jgi:hypothetical protein
MDGFGSKVLKRSPITPIYREPVQFTASNHFTKMIIGTLDHVHPEELLIDPKTSFINPII